MDRRDRTESAARRRWPAPRTAAASSPTSSSRCRTGPESGRLATARLIPDREDRQASIRRPRSTRCARDACWPATSPRDARRAQASRSCSPRSASSPPSAAAPASPRSWASISPASSPGGCGGRSTCSKLPRTEKKLRVALDWTLDLLFSKDLVQFSTGRAPTISGPGNPH